VPALNVVTPTPPVISVETNFLKVGTPADPLGLAYTILAAWDALEIVNVPAVVIGDPDTVNSAGADNATLVTDPLEIAWYEGATPVPLDVNTWPDVADAANLAITVDEDAYKISPIVNVNAAPVPPLKGFNVPSSVTAPVVAEDGVRPVVPALNDVTLIDEISAETKLRKVGTPVDPLGAAYTRFCN